VGLIGEHQREYGLTMGDHRSKVRSRKDTSTLFRTINFFDFIRRAYRNSTWKSLAFRVIFRYFQKFAKKLLLTSSCLSVCLSARNISASRGRILIF
jgi:hypothetical protein